MNTQTPTAWVVIETNADFGAHDVRPFAHLYQSKEGALEAIRERVAQWAKREGITGSPMIEQSDHGGRVFVSCEVYDECAQWLVQELSKRP